MIYSPNPKSVQATKSKKCTGVQFVSRSGAPEVFCYGSRVGRGCFSRDQGGSYQKEEGQEVSQ